jgi:NitT/TauT family transport system ATP-binding protein
MTVPVAASSELQKEVQQVLVEVNNLRKAYGEGALAHLAIADISLEVNKGEFVCIVGPSGCGKTTLLRCLAGLMPPSAGEVQVHGKVVRQPPQEMALVFQEYNRSLFPWMSVHSNVEMPLKKAMRSKRERARAVEDALEAVGLGGFGDRYPWQLSGGMQQRVAIARAVAYRPEILLMDEPFASVDAQTRTELEDLILRVRHEFDVTVLFVTHDIDEAVYLADRVVLLSSPPCTVKEILDVPLPRPRSQTSTKELPEFAHMRAHVYRSIMGDA